MKIKEIIKGSMDGDIQEYILILDNNTRYDINWYNNNDYYLDCHVYGPDDIEEWKENAKTMLNFYDVVIALTIDIGELELDVENFGSEQEISVTVHLNKDMLNLLLEKYLKS